MMTPQEIEQVLRDVNVRTSVIDQILPTLSTKTDLDRFATKDDLKRELERHATKDDLKQELERYPTKDDLKRELEHYPTKDDLKLELERFATKDDLRWELARYATKDDLKQELGRELERYATKADLDNAITILRSEISEVGRHARVMHEDVKADIRMLAEHVVAVMQRLDRPGA